MAKSTRSEAAKKAARKRKLKKAGKKAAATRKRNAAGRKAAATKASKKKASEAIPDLRNTSDGKDIDSTQRELDRMRK